MKQATTIDLLERRWDGASAQRGAEASWLRGLREEAWAQFNQAGIPTTRHENWRATNIAPVFRRDYETAAIDALPCGRVHEELARLDLLGGTTVVFIDGRFAPECSSSMPEGIELLSGADALEADGLDRKLGQTALGIGFPFSALNSALFADLLWLRVRSGVVATEPVTILHVTTASADLGRFSHPRTLLEIESGAKAAIAEYYLSLHDDDAVECTNAVTEVLLGRAAELQHLRSVLSGGFHFGRLAVDQAAESNYNNVSLTLSGKLVRNDLSCGLYGEGAHGELNGLVMVRDDQLVDNHTWIEHAQPECTSHELYKAILDDQARVVFNGRIHVHPGAQKTDAVQANRNLLLSGDAIVNTNPQLEIYADDVKCTHGATVGQLDEQAQFYLQARGLSRDQARALLVSAFAKEVLDHLPIKRLSDWASTKVDQWLARSASAIER